MKKTPQRRKPRRNTDLARLAGRTFTKPCAEVISKVAKKRGQSPTAVIVDVLEGWAKRHGRKRSTRKREE
jgi:hypothetical protein